MHAVRISLPTTTCRFVITSYLVIQQFLVYGFCVVTVLQNHVGNENLNFLLVAAPIDPFILLKLYLYR